MICLSLQQCRQDWILTMQSQMVSAVCHRHSKRNQYVLCLSHDGRETSAIPTITASIHMVILFVKRYGPSGPSQQSGLPVDAFINRHLAFNGHTTAKRFCDTASLPPPVIHHIRIFWFSSASMQTLIGMVLLHFISGWFLTTDSH
jgi:hypothetical protein